MLLSFSVAYDDDAIVVFIGSFVVAACMVLLLLMLYYIVDDIAVFAIAANDICNLNSSCSLPETI